ncbi:hypothetical protein [Bradyrhizobium zhanjiangense]|uniref:hypothetical protein n=1 Tax=Bradyrhizobium zhanjiangense TaxID=1325107 RepID=UPI0013E89C14|nr:hypothetical protein [Bradyrhizobium zhanjiangense]
MLIEPDESVQLVVVASQTPPPPLTAPFGVVCDPLKNCWALRGIENPPTGPQLGQIQRSMWQPRHDFAGRYSHSAHAQTCQNVDAYGWPFTSMADHPGIKLRSICSAANG